MGIHRDTSAAVTQRCWFIHLWNPSDLSLEWYRLGKLPHTVHQKSSNVLLESIPKEEKLESKIWSQ